MLLHGARRAGRGENVEAELGKLARAVNGFRLVLVADGDENAALMAHLVARGDESLEDGLLQVRADAQHFAGGLHLRAEVSIDIRQFLEGEARHLDRVVRALPVQPRAVAHVANLFAQHRADGEVNHRHARHLADVRHGAAGARVRLNDIDFVMIDDILNVDKPQRTEFQRNLPRNLNQPLRHRAGQVPRGIDSNGVAGVDAGTFHVFHDAGDEHIFPIANRVRFRLDAHQVLVNQHRVLDALREDNAHVLHNVAVLIGDNHVLTAQHIRRAHQHRVAQLVRRRHRFFARHDRAALGALDAVLLHRRVEALAVFRRVNHIRRRTHDAHARLLQRVSQLNRRLPAERRDDANRLLRRNHAQHVLRRQRLLITFITSSSVSGSK